MGRHRDALVGAAAVTVMRGLAVLLGVCVLASGCNDRAPEPRPDPAAKPVPTATVTPTATGIDSAGAVTAGPMILARGVRIVHAGPGDDATKVVRDERERAKSDGRDLIVYVGAKWCEPCQVFHKAAARGELDGEFPDLTLLEFDLDEDRDRITPAGYVGDLIPSFAMPQPDGRASSRRFEGSVKGNGAVANIAPRLRKILGK